MVMNNKQQFEIKPIVVIDYLTTKLTDIDNEVLSNQIETYGEKSLTLDSHSFLPNRLSVDNFKIRLKETLSNAVNSNVEIVDMWGNVMAPNESVVYHHHATLPFSGINGQGLYACVYYCRTPENCGDIIFRTSAALREYIATEPAEEGKLIIFPAEIPHYSEKNQSNINRISISANFVLT